MAGTRGARHLSPGEGKFNGRAPAAPPPSPPRRFCRSGRSVTNISCGKTTQRGGPIRFGTPPRRSAQPCYGEGLGEGKFNSRLASHASPIPTSAKRRGGEPDSVWHPSPSLGAAVLRGGAGGGEVQLPPHLPHASPIPTSAKTTRRPIRFGTPPRRSAQPCYGEGLGERKFNSRLTSPMRHPYRHRQNDARGEPDTRLDGILPEQSLSESDRESFCGHLCPLGRSSVAGSQSNRGPSASFVRRHPRWRN